MSGLIFAAKNITKQYRKTRSREKFNALANLHMEVHRGDIYGFVGENGAGKTTLMRILTGRSEQSSGELELFGKSSEEELYEQRGRIGALIESPALYPGMTAKDNLEVVRLQQGIRDRQCIFEVLKTVGLEDAAEKKVKDFSFGMKQRLGIAMSLLGNKEFLVLDEPINGLDPEGIVELREMLQKLNREKGVTILISSHLLGELNQLATCYGFVHAGKMVEQISAEELKEKCTSYLEIYVDNAEKAMETLQRLYPEHEVKRISKQRVHIYKFCEDTGEVTKALIEAGVAVKELKTDAISLESYYMSVIKGGRR